MIRIPFHPRATLAAACIAFGLAGVGRAEAVVLSTSFTVSGAVSQSMTFDLAALQNLPLAKVTEVIGTATYVGVSFWDLLNTTVGVPVNPSIKNDINNRFVVATGTDGYQQTFSFGELNPAFGNQPDIIAYQLNGAPLTTDGFARVVVPNDSKAGRWVSNLASLTVYSIPAPVPEPGSLALMFAGLAAVGGVVRAKSRRTVQ